MIGGVIMCDFCKNIGIGIPKLDFCNEKSPNYSGVAIDIRNITNNTSLVFTNSADEYGFGYIKINCIFANNNTTLIISYELFILYISSDTIFYIIYFYYY